MTSRLSEKILNHIKNSKTASGQVGCKVKASENSVNKAWISISAKKEYDTRFDPVKEKIVCYEVEYVELDKKYNEDNDEMDFDLFLVKKETYYNFKEIDQLEKILQKWLEDFSVIEPILNISYPMS